MQKIFKQIAAHLLVFVGSGLLYYSLFAFLLSDRRGTTRLGALFSLLKNFFTLEIWRYSLERSVLLFFIGFPSVLIAWLSGKFSNKKNFILLPVISLFVSLFAAPFFHIVIFRFPLRPEIELDLNIHLVLAAVFMLAFTFAAALWRRRERRIAGAAYAAAGWESAPAGGAPSAGGESAYWKAGRKLAVVIAIVLVALFGALYFNVWSGRRAVDDLARRLEKAGQAYYERMLADTYGGKTPQETLRLYIEAVEKGDYELASKYFVIEKQEEEAARIYGISKNQQNIEKYLGFLRNATPWRSSLSDNSFTMRSETDLGPAVFINFVRYPNDTWKILDI